MHLSLGELLTFFPPQGLCWDFSWAWLQQGSLNEYFFFYSFIHSLLPFSIRLVPEVELGIFFDKMYHNCYLIETEAFCPYYYFKLNFIGVRCLGAWWKSGCNWLVLHLGQCPILFCTLHLPCSRSSSGSDRGKDRAVVQYTVIEQQLKFFCVGKTHFLFFLLMCV